MMFESKETAARTATATRTPSRSCVWLDSVDALEALEDAPCGSPLLSSRLWQIEVNISGVNTADPFPVEAAADAGKATLPDAPNTAHSERSCSFSDAVRSSFTTSMPPSPADSRAAFFEQMVFLVPAA